MVIRTAITRNVTLLVLSTALLLTLLLFCIVEGFFLPIRVIGGSMAETFNGPHYKVCCNDCRFCFPVDATTIPAPRVIQCPNCGHQNPRRENLPILQGDPLLVDRVSYQFRDPLRWEAILFRSTRPVAEYCLKRVVGLPKESVTILAGDLWIDGQRLKKDWPTLRQMALLVHDSHFAPNNQDAPPRWRPFAGQSGWQKIKNGYRFDPKQHTGPTQQTGWIGYQHFDFHRGDARPTDRITDNYAYNQTLSRSLHPTDELILSAQVKCQGSGILKFRVGECELQLDNTQGRGILFHADKRIAEFPWDPDPLRFAIPLEVATVDQQFFFVLGDEVLFSCDLESKSMAAEQEVPLEERPGPPRKSPFALGIGSQALELQVTDLRILRDVYYTDKIAGVAHSRTEGCTLGEDEFFVLGDNSPVSLDSRRTHPGSVVQREDLRGRVWRWR